jgi:hypothetical protein
MYQWTVFLHVFLAFVFMLMHGVTAAVMLMFRKESSPERSLTFFDLLPTSNLARVITGLMGVTGFLAAFLTTWWRQGWVWASLVVFLIIAWVMYKYGTGYYVMIYEAANRVVEARKTNTDIADSLQKFNQARNAPHPMIVSSVGIGGLAILLWLMRFKPF